MTGCLSIIRNLGFSRSEFLKRKAQEQRKQNMEEIRKSIEYTKTEINDAIRNFNNVTEPRLVDFYIYKIQAEQSRYEQLLCEYKQMMGVF